MNRSTRVFVYVTLCFVLATIVWVQWSKPVLPKMGEIQEVSNLRTDYPLKTSNKKEVRLKDFLGKIVILHSFATWCKPCMEELPEMVEFSKAANDDTVILPIQREPLMSELNLNIKPLTIYFDESNRFVQEMGMVVGIPSTLILDKKGQARFMILGKASWREAKFQETLNLLRGEQ